MVPVHRAAVPALLPELVLALFDPLFGSIADGLHQIWVLLAELPLLVHQTGNVVTNHSGAQSADVPADTQPAHPALRTSSKDIVMLSGFLVWV